MMQAPIPERFKISHFMVAYVIVSMQIGIGVLGYQRIIAKEAGYDAWISILIAGIVIHLLIWVIYKICEAVNGDVITANVYVFGKILGNIINILFFFYFTLLGVSVMAGLAEVIQTWIFPNLKPFNFSLIYLLLGIYIVYGGFRTVAGISFLGLAIPAYLLFSFGFAIKYGDFTNLLPILDHSPKQLLKGAYSMSLSFLGFEALLFFYPYIKKPKESKKWVHIGVLSTTLIYTGLAIISFAYFPSGLLNKSIWATLEMWKIVRLPILERFEYLGIANWTLIILPNVTISLWCASRILKRVYHVVQRKGVIFVAIACLLLVLLIDSRERMDFLFNINSKIGFALAFVYPPILYIGLIIAKKVKGK